MKYLKYLPLLALTALMLTACGEKKEEKKVAANGPVPVRLMPLQPSGGAATVMASGKFTTDDEVYLSFKTGGVIDRILVKEGDAVRPGQLLATLHLTEINAQVRQVQAGFEKAERDYDRAQRLYNDSVASLEQLQNARTALELARQQLSAAQFNRDYSAIRAPRSGYVLHKLANEGQVVGPGTPVLQTNGAQSGRWILRVGVSDKDWTRIRTGNRATVHMESGAGSALAGTVLRRSEGVDPYTGSFAVDIQLEPAKDAGIASGMFGSAVIITDISGTTVNSRSWSIPYDALLDGDGSYGYVFVTHDRKAAQKIKVTISSMSRDSVQISGGLEGAPYLILSGSAYLADGSAIKVQP